MSFQLLRFLPKEKYVSEVNTLLCHILEVKNLPDFITHDNKQRFLAPRSRRSLPGLRYPAIRSVDVELADTVATSKRGLRKHLENAQLLFLAALP